MKKKHKLRFLNAYKWWDYGYLLQAIEDWCLNASKQHYENGNLIRHKETSHKLKVIGLLCKRIREDDYLDSGLFLKTVERRSEVVSRTLANGDVIKVTVNNPEWVDSINKKSTYRRNQRQKDLDYLCKLLSKHLFDLRD